MYISAEREQAISAPEGSAGRYCNMHKSSMSADICDVL